MFGNHRMRETLSPCSQGNIVARGNSGSLDVNTIAAIGLSLIRRCEMK